MTTYIARARLIADAVNRAARSIIHGIVGEVAVVVIHYVATQIAGGAELDIDLFHSAERVALFALASYLHRRYVDPSPIPSLLPPQPTPPLRQEPPA